MRKKIAKALLSVAVPVSILFGCLFFVNIASANVCVSDTGGIQADWDSVDSWSGCAGGIPADGDTVVVAGTDKLTLLNVDTAKITTATIESGARLDFTGTGNLRIGNLGANLTVEGTMLASGSGHIVIDESGTEIGGDGSAVMMEILQPVSFVSGSELMIPGINLGALMTVEAGANITVNGMINSAGHNVDNYGTVNLSQNFSATAGTPAWNQKENSTLNIAGQFDPSEDIVLDATAVGNTVNYSRSSGSQDIHSTTYYNLTIGNSSFTDDLLGDITINNNFITTAGGELNTQSSRILGTPTVASNGKIKVRTCSGALPSGKTWGGTVHFDCVGAITVASGTFNNLIISTFQDSVLGGDVVVNGNLSLPINSLNTATSTLSFGPAGTFSTTGGYIRGNLKKNIPLGAATGVFELGNGSYYTPVLFSFGEVTQSGNLKVTLNTGDHPNLDSSTLMSDRSANLNWSIINEGILFDSYSTILSFNSDNLDGGANPSNFIAGRYADGTWSYPTVGINNVTNTQLINITSFGEFVLAEEISLIPSVFFVTATSSGNEGTSPVLFQINLSATSSDEVTVDYAVTGGTAIGGGVDFTLNPGTLVFAPGEISKTITSTIINDAIYEGLETIVIGLSNPSSSTLGTASHTYTMLDSKPAPSISFALNSSRGSESSTTVYIAVNLSEAVATTSTVSYQVVSSTATAVEDYALAPGTLTFSPGETLKYILLSVVDDGGVESDESVTIDLYAYSNIINPSSFVYTITSDDTPSVGFLVTSSNGSEANTAVSFVVNLSNAFSSTTTVDYSVTPGTAGGGGVDYNLDPGTLVFSPGETTKNVTSTIVNDLVHENAETFVVTLSNSVSSTLGANTSHTYTINDNDNLPEVYFEVVSSTALENSNPVLVVNLSLASEVTSTVDYNIAGGLAEGNGVDYTLNAGTLIFSPGETTKSFSVSIFDDSIIETAEDIRVSLTDSTGSTIGEQLTHTYTIQDNDGVRQIGFAQLASGGAENSTPVLIQVVAPQASAITSSVNYGVTGGTATGNGTDFTLGFGSFVFAPGETTKNISIDIADDLITEGSETIVVSLSEPFNASIGTTTHTFTITDDEPVPQIFFASASGSGSEEVTPTSITVNQSDSFSATTTVGYRVAGGTAVGGGVDYTLVAGTLTFSPFQTTKTFDVGIVNDSLYENGETVILELYNATSANVGATSTYTYTITNNDTAPTVSFNLANSSNSEASSALIAVSLSVASAVTSTVDYTVTGGTATTGADFTLEAGPLTFLPGETSKNISVSIVNDVVFETNETVIITLSDLVDLTIGARPSHTLTITNNDSAPNVGFAMVATSSSEGVTPVLLNVVLSPSSEVTSSVSFSVTGGTALGTGVDYTLDAGNIEFVPGETSKNISIIINDDLIAEGSETIIVTLSGESSAVIATSTHTFTIVDNEAVPEINFSLASGNGNEDSSPSVSVNMSGASSATTSVAYRVIGGSAQGGNVDYNLVAGTLTFSPGQTVKTIDIAVANDSLYENNETAIVELYNATGANVGATSTYTYTINDNDTAPTVAFALASSSGSESSTPALLAVSLSAVSGVTSTVSYEMTGGTATGGGADYTFITGTTTFSPGESNKNISITIENDAVIEMNETVEVTLVRPSNLTLGATTVHEYTIIDNEEKLVPVLSVLNSSVTYNGGSMSASVTSSFGGEVVPGVISNVRYNGSTVAPTNVGTYPVTADFTPTDSLTYATLTNASAGNFAITPMNITVTASAGQTKVYGNADPVFTYSHNPPVPASFTGVLLRAAGSNVGIYAITTGTLAVSGSNLVISSFVSSTFQITPKPITVTVNAGQAKVEGNPDPVFTYTSSDPAATFTGALVRVAGEALGTYAINQGALAVASNYSISSFVSADFTISDKVTPTLSISNSPVAYNGSARSATVVGSVAGVVSDVKYGGSATVPTDVGNYVVTADFVPTDGATYNSLNNASAGNFIINVNNITVTAGAKSKTVGSADPDFTYSSSDSSATFTGALSRDPGETVGTYTIRTGTLALVDAVNYNLSSFVSNNLTINPVSTGGGGGGGSFSLPASTGDGASNNSVEMYGTRDLGSIGSGGTNVFMYYGSTLGASFSMSGSNLSEHHSFKVMNLNLADRTITFEINSVPQIVTLKLAETANVDLNNDKTPDLTIKFASLVVNRAELTFKPLVTTNADVAKPSTSTPATTAQVALAKYLFKRDLKQGMSGADVKELQKYLNKAGFIVSKTGAGSVGKETTVFGPATRSALIKFQKARKISPSVGYFGQLTRKSINGK